MDEAELRSNQSRQTALDEGTPSPEQEGEKICRQGLDNSGNIEALPYSFAFTRVNTPNSVCVKLSALPSAPIVNVVMAGPWVAPGNCMTNAPAFQWCNVAG